MRGARANGAILGSVVCAVLAAGCSSDPSDQPATLPPLTSTPTSTPTTPAAGSASASAPASISGTPRPRVPPGLSAAQLQIINAIKSYIAATSKSETTGDPSFVLMHVTSDCECIDAIKSIPDDWKNGGYTKTKPDYVRIISFGTPRFSSPGTAKVRVVVDVAAEDVFDKNHKIVKRYKAEKFGQDISTRKSGRLWKVVSIDDFAL